MFENKRVLCEYYYIRFCMGKIDNWKVLLFCLSSSTRMLRDSMIKRMV